MAAPVPDVILNKLLDKGSLNSESQTETSSTFSATPFKMKTLSTMPLSGYASSASLTDVFMSRSIHQCDQLLQIYLVAREESVVISLVTVPSGDI